MMQGLLRDGLLTIVLVMTIIYFAGCTRPPYGHNLKAGKYYNINGIKMYCEVYGSGKPLLLIHGNGGSISTFSGVIPFFSKKYKVIIADSRSQGRSIDPSDSLSFEQMADDYSALLDQMHISSANIFGWSDGGIIAILMAIRHPDKVGKFAASGANLWPDSTALEPDAWKNGLKEYADLKDKPKTTVKEKQHWKCLVLDCFQPNIPLADLHKIKCPALIMGGDRDVIRQKHLRLIYQNIPQANLWIVANSGHGVLFDHKYKFMYGINRFFSEGFNKSNTF